MTIGAEIGVYILNWKRQGNVIREGSGILKLGEVKTN